MTNNEVMTSKEHLEQVLEMVNERINGNLEIFSIYNTMHGTVEIIASIYYIPYGETIESPNIKNILTKSYSILDNGFFIDRDEDVIYSSLLKSTLQWMLFGKAVKTEFIDIPAFKDLVK